LTEADSRLGDFLNFLQSTGKLNSTLVMIGSKQGQGPINPKTLKVSNPDFMQDDTGVPVQFFVGEDGGVVSHPHFQRNFSQQWGAPLTIFPKLWLENSSDAQKAKSKLLANSSLGLSYVLAGDEIVAAGYGDPFLDPRVPDLILGAKVGTLWNGGFEFEDHGGFLPQDLNVPLIAYNPTLKPANITQVVSTRQVASTMLQALGLPLVQLDGYRLGDSPVLPGLFT
jgi:arylsulfatase A-like enzyme